MCVALPGKVIEVKDGGAVVARAGLVDVKAGDMVLVHAGCIIQKVSEQEADEMRDIFEELEAFEE